jgi:hypothetical protein
LVLEVVVLVVGLEQEVSLLSVLSLVLNMGMGGVVVVDHVWF